MVKTAPIRKTIIFGFDFDDTLAADTGSGFLEYIGADTDRYWKRVHGLIDEGWDPLPAQMYGMLEVSRSRSSIEEKITRDRLAEYGRQLKLFDGVEEMFDQIEQRAQEIVPEIKVEFYIISCGYTEIIRNTSIASRFDGIWANEFHYDESGEIAWPSVILSHTEKISYLYMVAKGEQDRKQVARPFAIAGHVPDHELRVPLDQVVYVGDGLTDVPCFAILYRENGIAIGVHKQHSRKKWGELSQAPGASQARVSNIAPALYNEGTELLETLLLATDSICKRIAIHEKSRGDLDGVETK